MRSVVAQASAFTLFGVLIAACSSNPVRVDQTPNAALACKTFGWRRAGQGPESFTEQRVRNEALQQLQKKGYALATDHPDCQVTYAYSTHEGHGAAKPRVGVGVGGGSGGIGGGVGVSLPIPGGHAKQEIGRAHV